MNLCTTRALVWYGTAYSMQSCKVGARDGQCGELRVLLEVYGVRWWGVAASLMLNVASF